MSLYKRGSIWWCAWIIHGKRIRETTATDNRKAAQEYHDRRRAEIWRQATLNETPAQTWPEAALTWATEHAQHKKSYQTDRLRLIWLTDIKRLGALSLPEVTTDRMIALRSEIIGEGKTPATANRHLAVVSAVLNYAHAKGTIPGVPKIPYLREPKERIRWITREQASALIAELPEHLAQMARFALATGLRRSNVTGLIWENIDIERRVAWIWPDEAKAGKPIAVPLNTNAVEVLEERQGKDARYVFTYRGKPVRETTTRAWYEACKRAGIEEELTWHDLRHTWASWHVMGGTPLEVLRQLGGWADMTMVLRYAHLAPGYVAGYAENSALPATKPTTASCGLVSATAETPDSLGWPMGLEPTTTGITIVPIKRKTA